MSGRGSLFTSLLLFVRQESGGVTSFLANREKHAKRVRETLSRKAELAFYDDAEFRPIENVTVARCSSRLCNSAPGNISR